MVESKVYIQDLYPLTPMQQGMLFHSLYQSEVDEYIAVIACRFKGEVVVDAMRSAWQGLLDQYDILRTGFLWEEVKQPLQRVLSHSNLPWCYEDWSNWSNGSEALKESKLSERIETERRKRFDLHQAPLMRITLIKLDENHYELIWTHHHILLDGWSLPIVMRQVMMNYQTVVEGKPLSARPAHTYREYIAWLLQQDKNAAERYWRQTLLGFENPSRLGIENLINESKKDNHHAELTEVFSKELSQHVKQFAKQHKLTLSDILQGIWGLLLSRYSNSADVLFGSTVSGRPAELPGIEEQVGLFINTLPIRIKLKARENGLEYLKRFQEQFQQAQQYMYSPLWDIQGWSELPRETGLFDHIFVYENYPIEGIEARTGCHRASRAEPLNITEIKSLERTNYKLTVKQEKAEEGILLRLDYI